MTLLQLMPIQSTTFALDPDLDPGTPSPVHPKPLTRSTMDQEDFQKLYKMNYQKVLGICANVLKDKGDAEDACQETFIRAWLCLPEFRGESAFSTWVIRIAYNRCFEMRRKSSRIASKSQQMIHEAATSQSFCGDAKLQEIFLEKAMAEMGSRQRLVLGLILGKGLSQSEVACQLRVSRPAVTKVISGIRRKLAEKGEKGSGAK